MSKEQHKRHTAGGDADGASGSKKIKEDDMGSITEISKEIGNTKESDQQATTSSNQSHAPLTTKLLVSCKGDEWDECELSRIISEKNFKQLKDLYNKKDVTDADILRQVALDVCNSKYREENNINSKVALSVFGEARDQLQLMGEDITPLIDASFNLNT